jgi:hypothetical protein
MRRAGERCACARVRETALIVVLGLMVASPAFAQRTPRVGELVEARILGESDSLTRPPCSAWIGAVAGDTLVLNRSASCARGDHVARVRVYTDDRGSRLKHTGIGFLAGAVTGGIVGRLAAGSGCTNGGGCDKGDAGLAIGVITLAGTVAGALVGVAVGVAMPAGRRWVQLQGERPIRAASIDQRPAVRLSLGERPR